MRLTEDDYRELAFIEKRHPEYPGLARVIDPQMERLATGGFIEKFDRWRLTDLGRAALASERKP